MTLTVALLLIVSAFGLAIFGAVKSSTLWVAISVILLCILGLLQTIPAK